MTPAPLKIAILGAGGVGGYFGGMLARAGADVVFLARGTHLMALRRDGLRVDSVDGDFTVSPVRAAATVEEAHALLSGPPDVALVCVKTFHLAGALEKLATLAGPETVIIPMLNGVEAADQIARAVGAQRVAAGTCRIVAYKAGPGHVVHVAAAPSISFGPLADTAPSLRERLERLRDAFTTAGVPVALTDDINRVLWAKFVFVAGYGAVGAAASVPVGLLRQTPESRALLERAFVEVYSIARARGVELAEDTPARTLAYLDALAGEAVSSLQRDLEAGRPTEFDAWVTAVIRLGVEAGVSTPLFDVLHGLLRPRVRATSA